LPALFVDGGNRGGAEIQQVGEQDDFPLVVGIPNYDAAQRAGTVGQGLNAGEANDLVSTNITILRGREFRFDGKGGIVFETRNEENPGDGPAAEKSVIGVAAIHSNDRARVQREGIGQLDITTFGFGE
jgi:hypothetical protein